MSQATQPTITRRNALHLAAGAAALAVVPIAAVASRSMTTAAEEWFAVRQAINQVDTDEQADPLMTRWTELDEELIAGEAKTPADAVAALEVARADMIAFKFGGVAYSDHGDGGDHLALSAIDNALRVLRRLA